MTGMNDREFEQLARQLGTAAAERLDVEATARAVVERLRQPVEDKKRVTWIRPEWLRVAAALAVLLGTGIALDRINPAGGSLARYPLEDIGDLTPSELTQLLTTLDGTLEGDLTDDSAADLENLTPAQLQTLLRSLET